ncbi:MAG: hypothetical protein WC003_03565 [Terrimicrobiaceae bacterium]
MTTDLLQTWNWRSFPRALWTTPLPGEDGAPAHRIIHARALPLAQTVRLERLGLRAAPGYHKCGSGGHAKDWVSDFRLLAWRDGRWEAALEKRGLPRPADDETLWFDLGGSMAESVLIEIRRCGIDGWWTPWALAANALVLEGKQPPRAATRFNLLEMAGCECAHLPEGVTAEVFDDRVVFRSQHLETGFRLRRPELTQLAINPSGNGPLSPDLLLHFPQHEWNVFQQRESCAQGPRLWPVGQSPVQGFLDSAIEGLCRVRDNVVTYEYEAPSLGQRWKIRWEVLEDRLRLSCAREGERDVRAWESGAWHFAFDAQVTPVTVLGTPSRQGQSGLQPSPVLLHAPRFGTLKAEAAGDPVLWRQDANRTLLKPVVTAEMKLGEEAMPEGDYLLRAGRHHAEIEFRFQDLEIALRPGTPPVIRAAVERCAISGLTWRADTFTLSNNGCSTHCPLCMDSWSALTTRMPTLLPGLHPNDYLRASIERWLVGAPGYASGRILGEDGFHHLEDEYLNTGVSALLGLSDYLRATGDDVWLKSVAPFLGGELQRMRARDIDGDGLIESPHRPGISGTDGFHSAQWSTNWFDVIAFGWKDAFVNALLHEALKGLAVQLPRLGQAPLAEGLDAWAAKLRANFAPTFMNPATGWLAGWRCKEDKLHDHAFLFVNGAAVRAGLLEPAPARLVMEKLWAEIQRVKLNMFRWGLPGNLWCIPPEDTSTAFMDQAMGMGLYENGGLTLSQARHFTGALYDVGMTAEADRLLEAMCDSLAKGGAFAGVGSGVDWRQWDGTPCGYEGMLSDQFGIIALALERHRPSS